MCKNVNFCSLIGSTLIFDSHFVNEDIKQCQTAGSGVARGQSQRETPKFAKESPSKSQFPQ